MSYLKENERYIIETMIKDGLKPKEIAERIGKHYTTVYREIKRGTVNLRDGKTWKNYKQYCADVAQNKYKENQTAKGGELKIGKNYKLVKDIEHLIKNEKYSPYAVSVYIKNNEKKYNCTLSKGTIYNYIDRGLFLNISNKDLPVKNKPKQSYHAIKRPSYKNGKGKGIEERPEEIKERKTYGHWEMDTVIGGHGKGKSKNCLLVLTERKSREEYIIKLKDKTMHSVVQALDKLEKTISYKNFAKQFKSITMDNGVEFLDYEGIEKSCINPNRKRTTTYYCHPYSSWERGSNENQNKLIRRWIPKGSDISLYSREYINKVQKWINTYPRLLFGGKSALECQP